MNGNTDPYLVAAVMLLVPAVLALLWMIYDAVQFIRHGCPDVVTWHPGRPYDWRTGERF